MTELIRVAKALGIENERGEIREGLYADFSLVDGDMNVFAVYKAGEKRV